MFNNIFWCLVSRATIGITDCEAVDSLRDRDNASGIGDNSAKIGNNLAEIGDTSAKISDDAAGIVDIAAKVMPC